MNKKLKVLAVLIVAASVNSFNVCGMEAAAPIEETSKKAAAPIEQIISMEELIAKYGGLDSKKFIDGVSTHKISPREVPLIMHLKFLDGEKEFVMQVEEFINKGNLYGWNSMIDFGGVFTKYVNGHSNEIEKDLEKSPEYRLGLIVEAYLSDTKLVDNKGKKSGQVQVQIAKNSNISPFIPQLTKELCRIILLPTPENRQTVLKILEEKDKDLSGIIGSEGFGLIAEGKKPDNLNKIAEKFMEIESKYPKDKVKGLIPVIEEAIQEVEKENK